MEREIFMKKRGETIIIGTRGSDLALVQARMTEELLKSAYPDHEVRREIIRTTGDRRTDVALADVAKVEGTFDKGVFIKELEESLDDGRIDIAVHSLKDLPTVLDGRFELAATLERAAVRDVLLTKQTGGMDGLEKGAKVGTSSVRRAMQLKWLRPDIEVLDLRGNVPTRVMKLAEDVEYDGILLAEAGLVRLGFLPVDEDGSETVKHFPNVYATRLREIEFHPAAGQGAIGLEVRRGDLRAGDFARAIGNRETWRVVAAEREFLRLLDGGCHTPVGVYSAGCGGGLELHARVFPEGGGNPRTGSARGDDPLEVARKLYDSLI